jgi:hypothetical protein
VNQRIPVMSTKMRTGACIATIDTREATKSQRVTLSPHLSCTTGLVVREIFFRAAGESSAFYAAEYDTASHPRFSLPVLRLVDRDPPVAERREGIFLNRALRALSKDPSTAHVADSLTRLSSAEPNDLVAEAATALSPSGRGLSR